MKSTPTGSTSARLAYAVKPLSWPKLLVPAFFGQALGFATTGTFSWPGLVVGALYVVTHLLMVVLLNDYADRKVDAIKREMFAREGSPKTIPDGILSERAVLALGIAALAACGAVAFFSERLLGRPGLFALGVGGIAIFLAYSFPPLRLNYRGGGELLEAFGVGYFLPAFEALLQGGTVEAIRSPLYVGTVFFAASSAVASGLSDERSDVRGGKRTAVTVFGNARARAAILALAFAGALAWAAAAPASGLHPALALALIALVAPNLARLPKLARGAVTDAFAAQAALKDELHRVIWRGTALLGVALVAQRLYESSRP